MLSDQGTICLSNATHVFLLLGSAAESGLIQVPPTFICVRVPMTSRDLHVEGLLDSSSVKHLLDIEMHSVIVPELVGTVQKRTFIGQDSSRLFVDLPNRSSSNFSKVCIGPKCCLMSCGEG